MGILTGTPEILARFILENFQKYKWIRHGNGFLICYLPYDARLHVWHKGLRNPGSSLIHNHKWDFRAKVLCGEVKNLRYTFDCDGDKGIDPYSLPYWEGELSRKNALDSKTVRRVWLVPRQEELYHPGMHYSQPAAEIHESHPDDGTVTFLKREKLQGVREKIYYKDVWVDAEVRHATGAEVSLACYKALEIWEEAELSFPVADNG